MSRFLGSIDLVHSSWRFEEEYYLNLSLLQEESK
jgi:hypothetical protein